ncbi:hypothetical protein C8J57DRAFT_1515435 [Mycena rebaudengoi]|nr:hypothetical protein C8J57DRAFT_1515435 [Mycena rebaudengoi]
MPCPRLSSLYRRARRLLLPALLDELALQIGEMDVAPEMHTSPHGEPFLTPHQLLSVAKIQGWRCGTCTRRRTLRYLACYPRAVPPPRHATPRRTGGRMQAAEGDILGMQICVLPVPSMTYDASPFKDSASPSPARDDWARQVLFLLRARRRCTERRAFVGGCRRGRRGGAPSPCARTLSEASRKGKSRCGLAGGDGGQEVLGIRHLLDVEVDEDVELGFFFSSCSCSLSDANRVARVGVGVEHLDVAAENLLLLHLFELPILPALVLTHLGLRTACRTHDADGARDGGILACVVDVMRGILAVGLLPRGYSSFETSTRRGTMCTNLHGIFANGAGEATVDGWMILGREERSVCLVDLREVGYVGARAARSLGLYDE